MLNPRETKIFSSCPYFLGFKEVIKQIVKYIIRAICLECLENTKRGCLIQLGNQRKVSWSE